MDRGVRKVVKEGSFVPMHEVDVVVVDKPEEDWTKDNKENV